MFIAGIIANSINSGTSPTLTYIESVTDDDADVVFPNTISTGLAILVDLSVGTSTPTKVIPTGFTELDDFTHNAAVFFRNTISYKFITSLDEGETVTGMDDVVDQKVLLIFTTDASTVTLLHSHQNANTGDLSGAVLTTESTGTQILLAVKGAYDGSGLTLTATGEAFDGANIAPTPGTLRAAVNFATSTVGYTNDMTINTADDGNQQSLMGLEIGLT